MAFHEGGEARYAKRHEEQAEGLPAVELHIIGARRGADVERNANNQRQAEGSKPEPRAPFEVADEHHEIPNEVTPQDQSSRGQAPQIDDKAAHGRKRYAN